MNEGLTFSVSEPGAQVFKNVFSDVTAHCSQRNYVCFSRTMSLLMHHHIFCFMYVLLYIL